MITIVSAFISNINNQNDINLEKYYNYGKLLLQVQVPKVIFVNLNMYNKIKEFENDLTKIILVNNNNLNQITNSNKNTLEYIFTMCHKTEWIKQAIKNNFFKTNNFFWVDFGIRHIFNCSDLEFINKIQNLQTKEYNKIIIDSIWNLDNKYFGGNKDYLLTFSNKIKEKCFQIIQDKKSLVWKVNIWYLIYLENKELFDGYHNDSLIINV